MGERCKGNAKSDDEETERENATDEADDASFDDGNSGSGAADEVNATLAGLFGVTVFGWWAKAEAKRQEVYACMCCRAFAMQVSENHSQCPTPQQPWVCF